MMSGLSKFKGTAEIKADLYALSWYPGIKLSETGTTVVELYEANSEQDAKILQANLDLYEGFSPDNPENSLFIRKEIKINEQPCSIYEYNQPINDDVEVVDNGDWNQHNGKT